jgi:eukaryotic-like serine/threonine-protein kinase
MTKAQTKARSVGRDELSTGTMLAGRYRVVGVVGRGGMSTVYRAEDTVLGRTVALKVMAGWLDGDEFSHRFQEEAQAAAGLNHPNIVTVYDALEDGGRRLMVMELVEGQSLANSGDRYFRRRSRGDSSPDRRRIGLRA